MGAVTFSLDKKLINTIKKVLPLQVFVETGTFKGDTVSNCLNDFDYLYSIELSEDLYLEVQKRFAEEQKVTLYHDDSAHRLAKLKPELNEKSVLYWLDAHWCAADETAGEKSQCPLLDELNAISALNSQSVIIIDDARLFLCAPRAPHEISQWPSLHQIIDKLLSISDNHRITIINDCIIYYPIQIQEPIYQYAQLDGVDWLDVMNSYNDQNKLRDVIEEKEVEIQLLSNGLNRQSELMNEKELAIHEKENEIFRLSSSAQELLKSNQTKDHAIQEKEQAIHEKENEITRLSSSAQELYISNQTKDHAIQEKEQAIHEKEKEISRLSSSAQELHISNQAKDHALQKKEQVIYEKEKEISQLNLTVKELLLSNQKSEQEALRVNKVISDLNVSLVEKELCIQAQDKFIKQQHFFRFYFLKACLNVYILLTIKYKQSIVYKLLNLLKTAFRKLRILFYELISPQKIKFRKKFGPFLGILNQYPPKEMTLPKSYYINHPVINPIKISIVTPSYQQAHFIERTLKSVLDQQYPNLEYFVQDGGSKDGTVDILQAYSEQLSGWESKTDKGQSHAINLGFAKTSGDIMAWLNSDDILLPGTLTYVANYFEKHPDVDVIYGNRIIINEDDREIGRWVMPRNDNAVLSWADFIPQETLFWRRSIWEKAGGQIDESFQFAMDWDLLVRFRDAGACINRIPRFMGAFRVHTLQKTSAAIEEIGYKEMQTIRARCNGVEPAQPEIENNIRKYLWWHFVENNIRLIHYKR